MKKRLLLLLCTVAAIFLAITITAGGFMDIFKTDFEQRWEALSKDVKKLNEYTKVHPIILRNVKVESANLEGAIFTGATFEGVEWENTNLEESIISKAVFKNCKFLNSQNWNSTFRDVVFENCIFLSAEFGGSTMVNVRFKGCKITDSRFEELTGNELVLEDTLLEERASLAESSIPMIFRKCTLDGVILSGMKKPHPMTLEDSVLDEVDFGRGHFSDVTLRRVQQGEGGVYFNGITAKSIRFEDVEMLGGTGIGDATVGSLSISGGQIYGPAFKNSHIAKTYIRDAFVTCFAAGDMGIIHVSNSTLHDSGLFRGIVEEFSVHNSTIDQIVGKNFKADTVIWDNVTLDGKIDFTNAHIKDFRPTRLKRGPRLQLITTGTNIRF